MNHCTDTACTCLRLAVPVVGEARQADLQQDDDDALHGQRLHLGPLLHLHQPHQRRLRQRVAQHKRRENLLYYRHAYRRYGVKRIFRLLSLVLIVRIPDHLLMALLCCGLIEVVVIYSCEEQCKTVIVVLCDLGISRDTRKKTVTNFTFYSQ